ncbi:MAG: FAD-dependent oxidoreductase [Phycisphaeraceae bacterium]|nr:FAD-dependent oxidoreductase [Phycisphaeraceae bacterium]
MREMSTDVLIAGGGVGGVAAALAATAGGRRVIMTEPLPWLGGQLTSQAVPPDENRYIENGGGTRRYLAFREGVRRYYREVYPLKGSAMRAAALNPGGGYVSALCHEPRIALHVMEHMLAPARSSGRIRILHDLVPIAADTEGDQVRSVTFRNTRTGEEILIAARYFIDATELGDLLPLANVEYVTGAESKRDTGEPHAVDGPAEPDNNQAITWCFPMAYDPAPGADHTIDKPAMYDHWNTYEPQLDRPWPGTMLSWVDCDPQTCDFRQSVLFPSEVDKAKPLNDIPVQPRWTYRRITRASLYEGDAIPHDVTLVNWPHNDYFSLNFIDQPQAVVDRAMYESRQLSLSLLYWMQTEAPNFTTGGTGYPGLYLVPEISGTDDGLAMAPYIRESRRIQALFTVTENHVGTFARCGENPMWADKSKPGYHEKNWPRAEHFHDSVGIGCYRIDLHMSTGNNNYIDISSLHFQIPLGSLIPRRVRNLLAGCKNLGVTHLSNGCYRLHPVEWNIGESAGHLAAWCLNHGHTPHEVHESTELLAAFQNHLVNEGIPLRWFNTYPI